MAMTAVIRESAERELQRLGKDSSLLSEDMLGNMLSSIPEGTEITSVRYNVAYWTQALLKKPSTKLRFDNPGQILYSPERIALPLTSFSSLNSLSKLIPPWLLARLFITNLSDVLEEVQEMLTQIEAYRETGNVIILSNHTSWLNLPLIAILLQTYGGIPKEHIFTLLGPAIMTQQLSYAGIANFSNLIKTVPDTINGNIQNEDPELEKLIQNIRTRMLRQVNKLFLAHNSFGNIFLVAPSGTTDIPKEGEQEAFLLQRPSPGTESFVKLLAGKEHNAFIAVGSNDRQVMPNNTSPARGEVYMHTSPFITGKEAVAGLLEELPQYVVDRNGKQIGAWKE